ncbi:hypothetical protein [Streptomyces sp. NPDC056105]|uniref:hypothetical protein n=1 Tax=Streptomyces sp. NPDC056105 TaxID=3345714 RepID=UPI0035DB390F
MLLSPPALRSRAHSIDHQLSAVVTYAAGRGASGSYVVHSLELDSPFIYGWTDADDEPHTFHLARIEDVDTEAERTSPAPRWGQ